MNLDVRKYYVGVAIVFAGLILLVRLFYLQVVDMSYKTSADNNSQRRVTQYPARGLIFDRNGKPVVDNEAAYDLMVVPRQMQPFDTVEFSRIVKISVNEIRETFRKMKRVKGYSSYKQSTFLRQMSAETYAVLQERLYKFPGFFVQARTLRNYVRHIAPHLLGYVTEADSTDIKRDAYYRSGDYIGKSGVERYYEKELRGRKGVNIVLVDVLNREVGPFRDGRMDTMAVVGSSLTLCIDADLQEYAEKLMSKMRGALVAIEPATGEILAMVSMPNYDPSLLVGSIRSENFKRLYGNPSWPLFDRAVMAPYPPGSTFKVAQGLVGLQEGTLAPNTCYGCDRGYTVGSIRMGCHGHASPLNLPQAIGNSCNAYFANVFRAIIDNSRHGSAKTNYETWRSSILTFGFGRKLGVDLPQEKQGRVPESEYYDRSLFRYGGWKSPAIISLSIGQGELGSTVLQMANFAALIANGGYYYTPHLIKKIDGRDTIPARYAERHYTAVDTSHFAVIREGMFYATTGPGGTARAVAIPGVDMCGKTGTAQNPHGKDHSTFMAFAPKDHPKIAVAAYVENAGWGASWAAPVVSLIIEMYLAGEVKRPWLEERMLNFDVYDNREPAN
jgi:penicillin-binding protein 2